MNRNIEEFEAMRKSSAALNVSNTEVSSRLERASDLISMMLMTLNDPDTSFNSLTKITDDLDRLIDGLIDTRTILRLILNEKALIQKLIKLDKLKEPVDESPAIDFLTLEDLENPNIDAATRERLKQEIEIHNLIDSIQASTENEELKKKLDHLHSLTGIPRVRFSHTEPRVKVQLPERPYRKLNIDVPTTKGEGYQIPKGE